MWGVDGLWRRFEQLDYRDLSGIYRYHTNSLRTVCILAFPSLVNMITLHFAFLLDVLFLQWGLQMHTCQAVSFRIERTISLSRFAKVLKLISLCNLHPGIKELSWRLLDLRPLAKIAQYCLRRYHCPPVTKHLFCKFLQMILFYLQLNRNVFLDSAHNLSQNSFKKAKTV